MSKFKFLQKPRADSKAKAEIEAQRPTRNTGAKRGNDDYVQLLAYVRKETRGDLDVALAEEKREGRKIEISELVDDLLQKWLKSRSK